MEEVIDTTVKRVHTVPAKEVVSLDDIEVKVDHEVISFIRTEVLGTIMTRVFKFV